MRPLLLFFFVLFVATRVAAQPMAASFEDQLGFVWHLTEQSYYDEAVAELEQIRQRPLRLGQQDTVHFMLGWNLHLNQQLDASSRFFEKVPPSSPFYLKSAFLAGINHTYVGSYDQADSLFGSVRTTEPRYVGLVNYERAGLALLQMDFTRFDSLALGFNGQHYAYAKQESKLLNYRQRLASVKRKSPLLAGAMSAVVPGTGKMYAGKLYQGLFSFLFVGVLAGATYEQYRNGGFENPQFYLVGSLFTIFYVGNIAGSIFSVKVKRNEQIDALKTEVLFNMHMPLRTVFE